MHLQPTHTHILHSASSQIPIWNPVGGLWWSFIAETVYVLRSLAVSQRNSIVDVWRNSKCDSVFGEGFHHWGYTGESWTPPASWFSWFKPNVNTRRWNLGLNPRPHFLEGEFIHLVDKASLIEIIITIITLIFLHITIIVIITKMFFIKLVTVHLIFLTIILVIF